MSGMSRPARYTAPGPATKASLKPKPRCTIAEASQPWPMRGHALQPPALRRSGSEFRHIGALVRVTTMAFRTVEYGDLRMQGL